ncbi:MAG: diacylglycerol kinase [Firmicutes bacterium]|nr:diacylglycerol kinase [Bacillota bacterium]
MGNIDDKDSGYAKKGWLRMFSYAWAGLIHCFVTQRNMKVHVAVGAGTLILAWQVGVSRVEMMILLLTIAGVLSAEIVNTAIEKVVDLVSPDVHPLAKAAKDMSAGAVLVMAITAVLVGGLLFWRQLFG